MTDQQPWGPDKKLLTTTERNTMPKAALKIAISIQERGECPSTNEVVQWLTRAYEDALRTAKENGIDGQVRIAKEWPIEE